jgi:hypothetical protein
MKHLSTCCAAAAERAPRPHPRVPARPTPTARGGAAAVGREKERKVAAVVVRLSRRHAYGTRAAFRDDAAGLPAPRVGHPLRSLPRACRDPSSGGTRRAQTNNKDEPPRSATTTRLHGREVGDVESGRLEHRRLDHADHDRDDERRRGQPRVARLAPSTSRATVARFSVAPAGKKTTRLAPVAVRGSRSVVIKIRRRCATRRLLPIRTFSASERTATALERGSERGRVLRTHGWFTL